MLLIIQIHLATFYLTNVGLFFGVCPEMNVELVFVEECLWAVSTLVVAHFEMQPFLVVDQRRLWTYSSKWGH